MCATSQWAQTVPQIGSAPLGSDRRTISSGVQSGVSSGWWFEEDSGVTSPAREFWLLQAVRNRHAIVLSFGSNTGISPPRCDLDSVAPYNLDCPFHDNAGYNGYTLRSIISDVPTIDGLTTFDDSSTDTNGTGFGLDLNLTVVRSQTISPASGRVYARGYDLTSAIDLTSFGNLYFHYIRYGSGTDVTRSAPLADHGIMVGLCSGTGVNAAYRFYDASALDTIPVADGLQLVLVDYSDTTNRVGGTDYGPGTFDLTNITSVCTAFHVTTNQSTSTYFDYSGTFNRLQMIGGDTSDNKLNWGAAKDSLRVYDQAIQRLGDAFESSINIQIGNGSSVCNFDTNGQSFSFPNPADFTAKTIQTQVYDSPWSITYELTTGNTANFDAPIDFKGGTLDLSAASNANATWTFDNGVWSDVGTWNATTDIGQISNLTIQDSAAIDETQALDFSGGCTISNTLIDLSGATEAALQNALDVYARCNLSGRTPFDLNLNYTGASTTTIELVAPTNIQVAASNFNASVAVALEITSTANESFGTKTVSGSATSFTEIAPVNTLEIISDTAATDIRYFDAGSQVIVDSTTGTQLDYEYPNTDPIDIELLKQNYVPINSANVTPFDGPLNFTLDFDEAYNSTYTLTWGVDADVDRSTDELQLTTDLSAFDVRSAYCDQIRTNSSYNNTPMHMVAIPGLSRIDLTEGMTYAAGDMEFWKNAGMEMFDATDAFNPTEKWFFVASVGDITGATVHFRQTDSGASTALTLTNNVVSEAFQYWDDPDHDGTPIYDYSGYMVIKSFLLGSRQARVDVVDNAGVSNLVSTAYTVPLANPSGGYSGTDPGISADITLVAGGTVGGVFFSYELVDGGTNSGQDIADQLNYNAATNPNGIIPGGTGLRYFELPDMVIYNATSVETARGFEEGTTPTLVGFYVSRGGSDHPDFTRFQGDNGSYYTPAVLNQATITNLTTNGADIRLQIYNVTTATEIYSADPGGSTYNDTYTEGTDYTDGDSVRIRFADLNGATSFTYFETFVTAGPTGWALDASNFLIVDDVYATNGIDGSTITKFTYTAVDDQFNLIVSQNFTGPELYAFYDFTLTTAAGIEGAFGAFVAADVGNYENITSIADIFLDNETTTSQRQTDASRIYRDDGVYPVLDPTTSGYGIDVNWQNPVVTIPTGSALTPAQDATLSTAAAQSTTAATQSTITRKINQNRQITDRSTQKLVVFDDDDTTVLYEGDVYATEDTSDPWDDVTKPILRRDKLS